MTETSTPHPHRWLILAVLASGLLLIAMDATILNVALPTLAEDLRPSAEELLWIVDAYGLTLAALLIAMGGLGDRVGRRRLLSLGLALFAAASVAAALASSPAQLVAARILLGVGGAMIMPSTLSILRNVFTDGRERVVAIGIWSAVASGGFAVGPVVGGALLEVVTWPWLFAVNIPVALVALACTRWFVPESRNPTPGPWDPLSVALSAGGMLALVWGIKHAGGDGLGDLQAPAAWVGAAVLLALFIRRQARSATPILDVGLFRDRRFSASVGAVLGSFVALGALLLLLTQYLQLVRGLSPLEAGIRLLPVAAAAAAASLVVGRLVGRFGPHLVVGGGFLSISGGLAILAPLDAGAPYGLVALGLAAVGVGAALASTAGSAAIMGAAPAERAGGAAAVQETAFELGGALGVAVFGSLMATLYRDALSLPAGLPEAARGAAREGLPGAAHAAAQLGDAGLPLLAAAQSAFLDGYAVTIGAAAVTLAVGAAMAVALLPRRGPGTA